MSACHAVYALQLCRNDPEAVQCFTHTTSPLGLVISLHLVTIIRYSLKFRLHSSVQEFPNERKCRNLMHLNFS